MKGLDRKMLIKDIDLKEYKGKMVFVRVDLNVLLNDQLEIMDDMCICVFLLMIQYLMKVGVKVVLVSYLGWLKKGLEERFSLKFVVGEWCDSVLVGLWWCL